MACKKFSSIQPVGDSEMAETSLIGGPQVVPQPGDTLVRCLKIAWGLLIFVVLCFVGHDVVYCNVLESKVKATLAPEFRLESATISLHELNSKFTAVEWEVKLAAINPNTEIGLYCHEVKVTVHFYGYGNFRFTVAGGLLPNFFIKNETEKVISFKLGMVRRSNDPMVSMTVKQLERFPRSVTLFGFKLNINYSYDNKKMCSVDCRGYKLYFWEPATFQSNRMISGKGISKGLARSS